MKALFLASLLVAALVAGCAAEPKADETVDPAAFDDVVVTDTTGAIRGVVVTEAIVPIEGALVVLAGGANKTTDAEGAFVFNGLEAGDYFLTVSRLGFLTVQTSATVVANQAEPPVTKVTLLPDAAAQKPFYQEYVFDGFIQCSGTFVAVSFAACSAANIFIPITDDRFGVFYDMTQKPTWMQTEMIWTSTQALGGEMTVSYSWGCDTNSGFLCDHGVGGTSPLLLTANATQIEEINGGNYTGTQLFVRSFNQGLQETDPDIPGYGSAPGGGLGFTLNQRFTYFSHFFYGYQPPEGWRFSEGAGVPQPPQ